MLCLKKSALLCFCFSEKVSFCFPEPPEKEVSRKYLLLNSSTIGDEMKKKAFGKWLNLILDEKIGTQFETHCKIYRIFTLKISIQFSLFFLLLN
jgi:hypothetical protein